MALSTSAKQQIVAAYQSKKNDTGSVEVQVALLTEDVKLLTEHLKINKHDFHSQRGLIGKVNKRRKLLKYLKRENIERYRQLISRLGLRDSA